MNGYLVNYFIDTIDDDRYRNNPVFLRIIMKDANIEHYVSDMRYMISDEDYNSAFEKKAIDIENNEPKNDELSEIVKLGLGAGALYLLSRLGKK
jgi:hypothetical protein